MSKFGDIYNFEEWGFRNVDVKSLVPRPYTYDRRIGEVVVVAHIGGNPYDGLILGTLKHPARKSKLKPNKLEYISEFNGLTTYIDENGAYKITFQGKSTTSNSLQYSAVGIIPPPQYNPTIAGSFVSIDKTGSLELNDSGRVAQSLKIDKSGGKISLTSGSISIELSRDGKKISMTSADMDVKVNKNLKIETLSTSISSTSEVKIKSAKIAIGSGGVELIDSILQIIDAVGTLVVSSPVGPCSPVKSAPTWAQIEAIKTKLSAIKGSL